MNLFKIAWRKAKSLFRCGHDRWFAASQPSGPTAQRDAWSIAIYTGDSPFELQPAPGVKTPALTASDVTDVVADFVADPFILKKDDQWYLFFEVLNRKSKLGQIGVATSADGYQWQYQRIVLAEPFHLSYPYVFYWKSGFYMIPETHQVGAVRLYKSIRFPFEWLLFKNLLEDVTLVDPSPFCRDGKWWMFAGSGSSEKWHAQHLHLFHAVDLLGPWLEHPQSPVVRGNSQIARPAGRVLVIGDQLFRLAQDCESVYGKQVRAFEITTLTTECYAERPARELPILKPAAAGWNSTGMHHLDAQRLATGQWLACVDGWTWVDP